MVNWWVMYRVTIRRGIPVKYDDARVLHGYNIFYDVWTCDTDEGVGTAVVYTSVSRFSWLRLGAM